MNENQLTEIRTYLLSKKLPLDLLIEVEDHFTSQITEMQIQKGFSFDNAFEKTKLTWREDLKMTTYANGKTFSKMYYQIIEKRGNSMMLFTLPISMVFCASLYMLMNLVNFSTFEILFNYLMVGAFLVPGLIFLVNFKDFLLIKSFKLIKLNIHQNHMIFLLMGLLYIGSNYQMFSSGIINFYKNSRFQTENFAYSKWVLFSVSSLFYFAGLFSQIQFLKVLKKTKPYLKNFQNYAK